MRNKGLGEGWLPFLFQAGKIPGSGQKLQIQDDLTALLGREVDIAACDTGIY